MQANYKHNNDLENKKNILYSNGEVIINPGFMLNQNFRTDIFIQLKANKKYLLIGSSYAYGNISNGTMISCMIRPYNIENSQYNYYGLSMARGPMDNGGGLNCSIIIEPFIDMNVYIYIVNYLDSLNEYKYICSLIGIEL